MLRRVALIQAAQRLGIPLAAIGAALAALPAGRTPSREDWQGMSSVWAADLDRRIAALTRLRDGLAGCIGCGCLSLDRCAIFNADDHLAAEGAGPVLLRAAGPSDRLEPVPPTSQRGSRIRLRPVAGSFLRCR